jgi:hypothetical protein
MIEGSTNLGDPAILRLLRRATRDDDIEESYSQKEGVGHFIFFFHKTPGL